jgi:peroxiredoxin family protein
MDKLEKVSIICSKGSLDMAYPGLVLANAARMSGIDVTMFFTFWGLDIVTSAKVDDLHLSLVGNPSVPIPAMIAGLPGVEHLATSHMRKEMEKADLPPVREFLKILDDSGAELYACQLAMQVFKRTREQLVPQVKGVISAMDFYDKSQGAQILFI